MRVGVIGPVRHDPGFAVVVAGEEPSLDDPAFASGPRLRRGARATTTGRREGGGVNASSEARPPRGRTPGLLSAEVTSPRASAGVVPVRP
jgi:hypothetical protein